jgi:hypothetical protein
MHAQSGTGKTGAFGIGLLARVDPNAQRTQALILSPTRDLADQTHRVRSLQPHPMYYPPTHPPTHQLSIQEDGMTLLASASPRPTSLIDWQPNRPSLTLVFVIAE